MTFTHGPIVARNANPGSVSVGVWELREESRKFWDYFVSDEVVYFGKIIEGNLEGSHIFAKNYLEGNSWIEIHWTEPSVKQGESHYNAVLELAHESIPPIYREPNIERVGIGRDGSMFIERPEFIQLPKQIIPVGCPSAIRLKLVEFNCHCGWKQTEPVSVGGIIGLKNRESNVSLLSVGKNSLGIEMRQAPSQVVERRPKAADEIPQGHRNDFRSIVHSDSPNFLNSFKICFGCDGIGWRIAEAFHRSLKSIEVKLRPTGLNFHIDKNFLSGRNGHE